MRFSPIALACAAPMLAGLPLAASAQQAPNIPEPMVFDMVRPLGARQGELEVNALAEQSLSGPHRKVEWAPEIEYAVADGFAVELELPFEGARVTDYKLGLQGTFGTFDGGRGVHGVQYLGLYNRVSARWENTLVYLLGHRFDARWSMIAMAGIGDVTFGGTGRSKLILNQSSFYDLSQSTTLGLEVNHSRGGEDRTLLMPQVHQALKEGLNVQVGIGALRQTNEPWRPRAAVRLIKEL